MIFAFNPATVGYFMEGRSDFFMYFFLMASLFLLSKKKTGWSSLFLAFAFAVKQSVWPFYPIYLFFIWQKGKWRNVLHHLGVFITTITIICLPFLLWDPKAFIESTVTYLAGGSATSYPISGYGFGMLLYQLGFIKSLTAYYPFTIWQAIVSIPALIFLGRALKKNLTIQMLLFAYGLFLLLFWYFARYLNNSHLGFISSVFLVSYFLPDEKKVVHTKS